MVKLTEVEDEHFVEKPVVSRHDELLLGSDEDDDFTDTDSSISDSSHTIESSSTETLSERLAALVDIIPPRTRATIGSATSQVIGLGGSVLKFTGKGLWVVSTSVLLLGIPYALAVGQEQEMMEREREEGLMREGASEMLEAGRIVEPKAAL